MKSMSVDVQTQCVTRHLILPSSLLRHILRCFF
uniref:Uncharacterized protein n=1 Tax=Arundo donax TaxID=35708 RepID=A0A0A9C501_ARUDO